MTLLFYYVYLIFSWGSIRYFFDLPTVFEELWIKPVIWLLPILVWNLMLGKRRVVMLDKKNTLMSISWGIMVGGVYFILIGWGRKIVLDFNLLATAMITSIVEELVFSGFVFGYLQQESKNIFRSFATTLLMVLGSRLPYLILENKLDSLTLFFSLLLILSASIVSLSLRRVTNNVWGSIVARWFLILAVS